MIVPFRPCFHKLLFLVCAFRYYRALAEVFDTEEELPTCPTPTVAASVGEEDKGSAAAEQKAAPIAAVQKVVEVKQSPITIKSDEKITAVKAA